MNLAGTASSQSSISSVSWSSDRGGNGTASGTYSWQIDNVGLELGENKITVSAKNSAGSTGSRTLVVNRESGQGGSITLSWYAPSERTDGSPLNNLAGYKIYYGRMSGIYDYRIVLGNPGIATYVVDNLLSGDWYFAMSAYDSNGSESDRSNEVNMPVD